jgi:hypothetical protein
VTSQDCPGIAIYAPVVEGGDVTWMLLNDTGAEVTLLAIPDLSWGFTGMSGGLERILLGDRVLAEGEDLQGELNSEFPIGTLAPGRTTPFTFEYPGPAGRTGYAFTLEFDVGCALSGTW